MNSLTFHRPARLAAVGVVLLMALPALAAEPWKPNQVLSPAALASQLKRPQAQRPVVLQVGFRILYDQGHIPGAEYCGPARDAQGREALRRCAQRLPKNREVVLYCGCCPWQECPNIRPAFKVLAEMGFRRLRVLDIPDNFEQDWIAKGYPTSYKH